MPVSVFRDRRELSRSALKQHVGFEGDNDFRIARFSEKADLAHVVPGANYHSICLVERGGMIRIDRKEPTLGPGKIVVDPNWFEGTFTNDENTDWICAYVKTDCFDDFSREASGSDGAPLDRVSGLKDPRLALLIRSCADLLLGAPTSRLELDAWAQIFSSHLHQISPEVAPAKPQPATLSTGEAKTLLTLIEDELSEDVSLTSLSHKANIGKTRLCVGFRDVTGMSVHQYVLSRRLERARDLISRTKAPLSEIAYAVGFSSQSHMTSAFGKRFGFPPARYRAEIGKA